MRLRRPVCLSDDEIVDAVMTPAEPGSAAASDEQEGEEGESTSLDLPGHPQAIAALDTLQLYLLGVSHSDKAQISLLSVEQFIERTMHYATDTLFLHRNRVNKHGRGILVLVYAYMHIHVFFV